MEQNQNDMIPPVPSLPELHRQSSPHGMIPSLQSPLSASYHIPSEYHQASPTNASFGYTGGPGPSPGDYGNGQYYTSPTGPPHGYMNVAQSQHLYEAQQRERARMMMDQGAMGMGM